MVAEIGNRSFRIPQLGLGFFQFVAALLQVAIRCRQGSGRPLEIGVCTLLFSRNAVEGGLGVGDGDSHPGEIGIPFGLGGGLRRDIGFRRLYGRAEFGYLGPESRHLLCQVVALFGESRRFLDRRLLGFDDLVHLGQSGFAFRRLVVQPGDLLSQNFLGGLLNKPLILLGHDEPQNEDRSGDPGDEPDGQDSLGRRQPSAEWRICRLRWLTAKALRQFCQRNPPCRLSIDKPRTS
ncbi:MAG: hypothetical protein WCJ64_08280 [Rhodospirillaceae bacterium]